MLTLAFPYVPVGRQLTFPLEKYPTPQRLEDAGQRTLLFEGIVEHGSVRKACEALGFNRSSLYIYAAKNPEFETEFRTVRAMVAEMLYDEANEIADDSSGDWIDVPDGRGGTKRVVDNECVQRSRLRIETRIRTAGKLVQHLKDGPTHQINFNDNRQIVVTDEKRLRLQERLKRLQDQQESNDNNRSGSGNATQLSR